MTLPKWQENKGALIVSPWLIDGLFDRKICDARKCVITGGRIFSFTPPILVPVPNSPQKECMNNFKIASLVN